MVGKVVPPFYDLCAHLLDEGECLMGTQGYRRSV